MVVKFVFGKMELVSCTEEYWEFVRALRNDPRVQHGFIEEADISKEQQKEYMEKYSQCYRIALEENDPIGFVGVVENDIRVCTSPESQGKGAGKFMINEIIKIFPNAKAKIKIDNKASLKAFESCGFKKKYYILEL